MKKFKFKINEKEYQVEVQKVEDNNAEVNVNGTVYNVELQQEAAKSVKTPKLVRSVTVSATDEGDKAKTSKPAEKKGSGNIKAPLPGIILSVLVKEGDKINIGDKLIIMEAMKMENNIHADKQGTVAGIKVKQGDSVLEGDVLLEIN